MDLRQLRYLIAVIDHGGVRRAADHLNIAQPAVGRQIRLLETTLKIPLLIRKGRNVVPTPAALELADRARGWLREIERTGHDLKLEVAGKRGRLIVGYSDDILHGEISRRMTQFISTHPQVDVELKFELTSDLAANVSRQLIDCAIIGGPAPSHISNLNEIHLAKHSLYLAVSLTHSFKDKVSITLGECHQEKFIIADTQTANGYTTAVMSAFRRADLYPDVITNIFPTDMILNMVADNIGISLVSRESALHRQDIRLIPIKPPPFINISLIQPSEARPIVETFVSMMVAKERQ